MYDSTGKLHENDTQNLRKHRKMVKRAYRGKLNPNCKWAKKHSRFISPYNSFK